MKRLSITTYGGIDCSILISFLFLIIIFGAGTYYFFTWPIAGLGDTDLWYHLNGGRFFFRYNEIPHTGFFSFIAEQREWENYYWLFQVLTYSIHYCFDYNGLIIFRTLLYLITIGCITRYLTERNNPGNLSIYFSIVSVLFFLSLIPRYFAVVRPHIFSYLFIVLFVIFLDKKTWKRSLFLPFFAALWSNLHGVEYPVLFFICFSYLLDFFIGRFRSEKPLSKEEILFVLPIVLCIPAILINPFGIDLLHTPFLSAEYQYMYVRELRHIQITDLFSFDISSQINTFTSLSNLLLALTALSLVRGTIKKNIRISHLLMVVGGVYLLTCAHRFRYEAILLALPIIRNHPILSSDITKRRSFLILQIFTLLPVLLTSLIFMHSVFRPRPQYPFSAGNLPAGITSFLNKVQASGNILNDPSFGGYLQWELDEKYSIFMDLQMMLFTDTDAFVVANSFQDSNVLDKIIDQNRPAFIVSEITNRNFQNLTQKFQDYRVVFFDDTCLLFADQKQHPDIVADYELKQIDPFALSKLDMAQLSDKQAKETFHELLKLYSFFPDGKLINQALAQLYRKEKNVENAIFHAEALSKHHPESPVGHLIMGDIHMTRQSYREAVSYFTKALQHSTTEQKKRDIYGRLYWCYLKLKMNKEAYISLKNSINIFSVDTTHENLYNLGKLALSIGEKDKAREFFNFALIKAPAENQKFIDKIIKQLANTAR